MDFLRKCMWWSRKLTRRCLLVSAYVVLSKLEERNYANLRLNTVIQPF
jgi:hypothetical protein